MRTPSFILAVVISCVASVLSAADPGLKPKWDGLVDPFGLPPSGWESTIDECVLKVNWKVLESTEGNYTFGTINTFIANAKAKNASVYLRLMAGSHVPNYLMTRAGSVTLTGVSKTETIVQWWKPEVRTAYRNLLQRLALEYDGSNKPDNDRLRVITMSRCMTIYAEPFQRGLNNKDTRDALRAVGYDSDVDKVCQLQTVQDHADFLKRTRSSIALNPYQELTATNWDTDIPWTLEFMDQAKAILGERLLLQNNSLRPLGLLGGEYDALYNKMHEMFLAGTTIGFQCATMERQEGGLKEAVQAGINFGASYIELCGGYTSASNSGVTRAEFDAFDAQLEAQVPPEPSLTFTRADKWNASNSGANDNSGYNANNHGVTSSRWIYENVTSGGALDSPTAWYKESGTQLVWDIANSDWDDGTSGYPQIVQAGLTAHSSSSMWQKAPRCSWIAAENGKVTLSGKLTLNFYKDTAGKSSEWAIAKKSGGTWTLLASGTGSINDGDATSNQVKRDFDLLQANYPALTDITVKPGDLLVWSQRVKAASGGGGIRLLDELMQLKFVPGDAEETATEDFEIY